MTRNEHDRCGVRNWNGIDYVASERGRPCRGVARYSGTFREVIYGETTVTGLCEHHATEAFLPLEMGQPLAELPAVLVSMHSLPREVYERNLARASFSEAVA